MSDKSDSLLNAMDGVARYEARQAMLRRDPAQAIPELVRMLAQGEARYPREIMALLGELGGQAALADLAQHPDKTLRSQAARALKALQDRPAPAPPTAPAAPAPRAEATPRAEKTLDEIVASHLTWLGNSDKTQRQRAARSHDRLVEIGAPAVPALVARLYDERGKTQRFAILQVLGAIGEQGVAEAITALQAASTHDEPGISGPAKAVLKKTGLGG